MNIAIGIAIYLVGCVSSYIYMKRMICTIDDAWTVGERNTLICISLVSWLGVLIAMVSDISNSTKSKRPSKW